MKIQFLRKPAAQSRRQMMVGLWGLCLILCATVNAQTPYLVYDMSEISGTMLIDASGNNRNATMYGNVVQFSGGPWLEYINFFGNSYVQQAVFDNAQPFALNFAFRVNGHTSSATQCLVGNGRLKYIEPDVQTEGFAVYLKKIDDEYYRLWADFGYSIGSEKHRYVLKGPRVRVGDWTRVQLGFDGKEIVLYAEGKKVASECLPDGATVPPCYSPITLGRLAYSGYFYFNGDMDRVELYQWDMDPHWINALVDRQQSQFYLDFNSSPYSLGGNLYFKNQTGAGSDARLYPISGHVLYQASDGIEQGCAKFDGSYSASPRLADYLVVPTHTDGLDAAWSHGFSFSLWVKINEMDTGHQAIISNSADSNTPYGGFGLKHIRSTKKLSLQIDLVNKGRRWIESDAIIEPGTWHHVAVSFDGSSIALYVNGVRDKLAEFSEDTLRAPLYDTFIGVHSHVAGMPWGNWFPASMQVDRLRICDHPLGKEDVYRAYREFSDDRMDQKGQDFQGFSYTFDHPDFARRLQDGGSDYQFMTLVNGAQIGEGIVGKGLVFDGSNHSYISGTSSMTRYDNAFTFSAWVKVDQYIGNQTIVSCDRDMATGVPGGFALVVNPNDGLPNAKKIVARIQLVGEDFKRKIYFPQPVTLGEWTHVAYVFDSANGTATLYVNGVPESASGYPQGVAMWTPPRDIHFGVMAVASSIGYCRFDGTIDDILMVNRVMSSSEIQMFSRDIRMWTGNAISDDYVLPEQLPWHLRPILHEPISYNDRDPNKGRVYLSAAPGEDESATLVVQALKASDEVKVEVGNLVSGSNIISSGNVSIKLVKCWYQGYGDSISHNDVAQLKPELLVNDPSWIVVDHSGKSNSVVNPDWPTDASVLQDIDLAAGESQQYWFTVSVPSSAVPGNYDGTITVKKDGVSYAEVPLRLAVPDHLALSKSRLSYGIYYAGQLTATPPTSIGCMEKTSTQYAAEMADLVRHGITAPTCYAKPFVNPDGFLLGQQLDFALMDQEMALRTAAGLPGYSEGAAVPLLSTAIWHSACVAPPGGWTQAAVLADYDRVLEGIINHFSQADTAQIKFPEPLFYGIDEAQGGNLTGQIPAYQKIRDKGGRSAGAVYGDYYATLGGDADLIDFPIMNIEHSLPSEISIAIDSIHADGHAVWSYHNPQFGVERPALYRAQYGLPMWAAGLDGECNFAYQWKMGSSLWNDFDHSTYRELMMAYPTSNGVVGTIQWEGFREAVDDVKYLSTLLDLIDACKDGRSPGDAIYDAGVREEAYLARLKAELQEGGLSAGRLPAIREALVRKIQSLAALNP